MNSHDFLYLRKKLNKTQKELALLLGTSIKAIHSYEQGWRSVPVHVERHLYFLVSRTREFTLGRTSCWVVNKCPAERRRHCPAWEFRAGDLCWFINGTLCDGKVHKDWREKIRICKSCKVVNPIL